MDVKSPLSMLSPIQLLQVSFFALLALTLFLHGLLSSTSTLLLDQDLMLLISKHKLVVFSLLWCTLVALLAYLATHSRRVLLLDYSCFRPEMDRKLSYEVCEYIIRRSGRFMDYSENFMCGIYLKYGLGDETYGPPFIFQTDYEAKFQSAIQEAEELWRNQGGAVAPLRSPLVPPLNIPNSKAKLNNWIQAR